METTATTPSITPTIVATSKATQTAETITISNNEFTKYEINALTYEIPAEWKEEKEEGHIYYKYNSDNFVMIDCFDVVGDSGFENADLRNEYSDNISGSEGVTIISNEVKNFHNVRSLTTNLNLLHNEITYYVKNFSFVYDKKMYSFNFVSTNKENVENLNDIVDKITFIDEPKEKIELAKEKAETKEVDPPAPTEAPSLTMGQKNALSKAESYLSYMPFSYSGLIKQLEFEEFSTEDATYAADNCGADWKEQAALKAQQYLDYTSFSRNGLIKQLEFEGFTKEQAEYGVNEVGY